MQKKILYLGNKTAGFSNNKSVIDSLTPLFSEFSEIHSASGKKNKFLRFLHMNLYFFKYGFSSDRIIIDAYSTFAFYFAFYFAVLSFLFRRKYILFLHGGNLPHRYISDPALIEFIFKKSSKIIAPSNYLASFFRSKGFEVEVIPNFVYLKDYPFLERKIIKPNIFSMRGLSKPYNPLMTLKAIHLLKDKYPNISLLILGNSSDEFYDQLILYIKENELESNIKIRPKLPKSDWIEESKKFDIMVSNPTIDNTPTSLIEGMALGMCVISTNVGGIPFFVSSREIEFVKNEDFKDLSRSIDSLITNSDKANSLSINGRLKAEEFDWVNVREKWKLTLGIYD